jgi:methylmalonyl-CoA/ethylmalonyl-CoA epimerase
VQLRRLDHIGIAVADLAAARALYERAFGLRATHEEVIPDQGVHELLFPLGDAWVQLVAPLGPDTPVGRFLARRGEGIHHVGYAVVSVEAAIEQLGVEGVEMVDKAPRTGSGGTTVAFVHPKGTGGVLVELVEEGSGHRGAAPPRAQPL